VQGHTGPYDPHGTLQPSVYYSPTRNWKASDVEFVSETARNPFGIRPDCERFVPGYGDASADFHVVGDHPGVHGGRSSEVPFTDRPWSDAFFDALERGGLLAVTDDELVTHGTFLSYLHACDPGKTVPDADAYAAMEPYFDAELRAVTAHILFPVGARATEHVLSHYTSKAVPDPLDMDALHGQERQGAGWLVVPVADPAEWTDGDADHLADRIEATLETDYRQVSDLGRFIAGGDPYFVR
jgi:uracil-DNA glycosylase